MFTLLAAGVHVAGIVFAVVLLAVGILFLVMSWRVSDAGREDRRQRLRVTVLYLLSLTFFALALSFGGCAIFIPRGF